MSELRQLDSYKKPRNKKTICVCVIIIFLAIATVAAGAIIRGKSYLLVSVLIALYAVVPFFFSFEQRKPEARELVTLAVMCALAVASRAAFIWVPHIKPMAGIIFITGIALGPTSGFLCGSLSALVSNFIFGQGPWTPFQMLTFGLGGFLFGTLSERRIIPHKDLSLRARVAVSVIGFLYILFIGGPILDIFTVIYSISKFSWETIAAIFVAGFPVNFMHGVGTFAVILLLSNPILDKLDRLRTKYGMFS